MQYLQKLSGYIRRACDDFNLIQPNDTIAIGVSGGKDSLTLLTGMKHLSLYYPIPFQLKAIHINMGFANNEIYLKRMQDFCMQLDIPFDIVNTDIAQIIFNERKEKNPCSLCSKMRRGALNNRAKELHCNKIALGHHSDDLIETFLLSLCYEGRLSTFAPYSYMDRSDITLIRPLLYTDEKFICSFAKELPVCKNPCPADKHTQREYIKNLIQTIKKNIPFVKERIQGAILHPDRYNLFDQYVKNTKK